MLSVDGKVEMTLKPSAVSGETSDKVKKIKWSDLQEGMSLDGRVKTVREYGVFVRLAGSKIDGLCHRYVRLGELFLVFCDISISCQGRLFSTMTTPRPVWPWRIHKPS